MSRESAQDLNTQTLIGMTEERGPAWHRRDDLQGDEDNHYPRFIPTEDVVRRLFNWEPIKAPVAYLVPWEAGVAGEHVTINNTLYRVELSQRGRVGTLRGDNLYDMGVFMSSDVQHPPYQESLIREAELLTGQELGVSSAGLLAKGSRAWLEISFPQTLHDEKSGLDYRPNILKADSMDGSLANTTALTVNATVCDNTLTGNLLQAAAEGVLVRRKHTSLSAARISEERQALGILNELDDLFVADLHRLIEQELSPRQEIEVFDIIIPLPEEEGRTLTMRSEKRDQLMDILANDPMVSPWRGTAFGIVQLFNTYDHHYSLLRGEDSVRWERNTWKALNGKRAQADRQVVQALEMVLA